MERETGIEPALVAWKATVLPLNYSRPGVLHVSKSVAFVVIPARSSTTAELVKRESSFLRYRFRGGGRWITPGILPSAPPGPAFRLFKFAPGEFVEPAFCFRWFLIHLQLTPL